MMVKDGGSGGGTGAGYCLANPGPGGAGNGNDPSVSPPQGNNPVEHQVQVDPDYGWWLVVVL